MGMEWEWNGHGYGIKYFHHPSPSYQHTHINIEAKGTRANNIRDIYGVNITRYVVTVNTPATNRSAVFKITRSVYNIQCKYMLNVPYHIICHEA